MRAFKKYPNRRLYDIEESKYVTVEDIRKIILNGESITVVDSKTGKDLTRTVLMQIISEQEGEGHEPILTNRVLEQLIRFYGDAMQSIVGRYIEQSITTFLEHQDRYQRSVRDLTSGDPLKLMRNAMEQNMEFWNRMAGSAMRPDRSVQEPPRQEKPEQEPQKDQAPNND
ncbi:MAG: polyhydroxyalkanoate synthesis repressor PhaR [Pseudomonadales bacterium]|jgi:polyhydroxyalkanoate synthesis repressor PhaR|nr:polyhydroxyalkanoate synthesis repressor PhaR [Pseudomonadales bacterium]